VPESLGYHQIDLDKINFRNPYTIGVITSKLLRTSQEVVSQRRESIPNTVHFLEAPLLGKDTYAQFFQRLLELLWHIEDAGVEPQDVMLVTVAGTYDAGLLRRKLLQTETGSYDFIHVEYASSHESHASSADKRIVWSRLFDAKGREFPVVILVDLPDLESEFGRSQAYVAATRATSLLYILGSKSQLDQWRPLFRT
jgi:superfamily I DNA and RNA helicase